MTVTAIYRILNHGEGKFDPTPLQDHPTTMAPIRSDSESDLLHCCPRCPKLVKSSSGLTRHRTSCQEYLNYTGACHTLHQQVVDGHFKSKSATTSSSRHSPQTHGRQLERYLDSVQSPEDDIVSTFFIIGHRRWNNLTRVGTVVFLRPRSNRRCSHGRRLPSEPDGFPSRSVTCITYSYRSQATSTSDSILPPAAAIRAYITVPTISPVGKTTTHPPIASALSGHIS